MNAAWKSQPERSEFPPAPLKATDPITPPAFWPIDCLSVWILLDAIRKTIDTDVERESGDAVAYRLMDLEALLGTSAYALSEMTAKREAKRREILGALTTNLPASLQRDYVNSMMGGYIAAYEYADRLNASLVHAIDAMRSVLSWLKCEKQAVMK